MKRPGYKQKVGRWGERLAEEFLIGKGLEILERNYYTPAGELDLIARYQGVTIFVEVKTRTNQSFGYPEDSITEKKKNCIIDSAQYYLCEHPDMDGDWRIDILAVELNKKEDDTTITWFENAIF